MRRARLASAMISTPGQRASRRRQRGALPAWSCHRSYDRGVILIQTPTVAAFPDQDFRSPNSVGRAPAGDERAGECYIDEVDREGIIYDASRAGWRRGPPIG